MDSRLSKMIEYAVWYCASANLGYDQWNRWDFPAFGDTETAGECDCSSLVYQCAVMAGFDLPSTGTRYTGTMKRDFTRAGFDILDASVDWQAGDILWKSSHTAIWTGKYIAEAYGDENGGAHSGKDGDQLNATDHGETRLSPARGGWECVFRLHEEKPAIIWPQKAEEGMQATDFIIEEGSNNEPVTFNQAAYSYRWEKYASGKLVCYISDWFSGGSGKAYGNGYYLSKTLEFPSIQKESTCPAYVEEPRITGVSVRATSNLMSVQFTNVGTESAQFWVFGAHRSIPRFSMDVRLEGSWK